MRAYAVFDIDRVEDAGGAVSEYVDTKTKHGFKKINRLCTKCAFPIEIHVKKSARRSIFSTRHDKSAPATYSK